MEVRPFEGIKVLDFTWGGVGPFISNFMAWYGATVVKIENKRRPDITRGDPPYVGNVPGLNRSLFFSWSNCARKYDVTIDLNKAQGVNLCKKMIARTDVILDGFVPGTMEKWGLGYKDLVKIKPDIIMLRTCTHGQTGPLAKQPALGFTLTTLAGFNNLTGWPDRGYNEVHGAYSDFIPSLFGGFSVIAALDYRRRTGRGQCLDLSQHEAALQFLSPLLLDGAVNNRNPTIQGNGCSYAAPHGAYRCSGEDRWCAISVYTDEEWRSFCSVLGGPDWTKDPRFESRLGRVKNSRELDHLIEKWTIEYSAEEVMSKMQAAGVSAGLVASAKDMMEDPQFKHYSFFNKLEHPEFGEYSFYRTPPFRLSDARAEITRAPLLGEHNEYVCKKILDMSDNEYEQFVEDGVFD